MDLRQAFRRFKWQPSGTLGVKVLGHRRFVGGHWGQMGKLQLDFMRGRGLEPHHVLVDVACGSLRAGQYFIPYLEPGHYLGIEREQALIDAALAHELAPDVAAAKKPELLVDSRFAFASFSKQPDFGIANSLFSHLSREDIELCLGNLREHSPQCDFYATFRPDDGGTNPKRSSAHADFRYNPEQMAEMGSATGWATEYIGGWGHPTGQHMMRYHQS